MLSVSDITDGAFCGVVLYSSQGVLCVLKDEGVVGRIFDTLCVRNICQMYVYIIQNITHVKYQNITMKLFNNLYFTFS